MGPRSRRGGSPRLVLALIALGVAGCGRREPSTATPHDAYRSFVAAMLDRDEDALRAVILPSNEIDVLLRGQVLTRAQVRELKKRMLGPQIRRLEPNEVVPLPGGRTMTVPRGEADDEHALLLPEGSPVPVRCRKYDGSWRVDAGPIIEARKAAFAAQGASKARPRADTP